MNAHKVTKIKYLLETGQYRIDPYVIADAIISWAEVCPVEAAGFGDTPQNECSNPESSRSASVKTAPVAPPTTAPIKVKVALAGSTF
jgi:hypothetical protein